jgi:hypothetical protein
MNIEGAFQFVAVCFVPQGRHLKTTILSAVLAGLIQFVCILSVS